VFSDTRWHNFIPAHFWITETVVDGPLKLCRVAEKPAAKSFTALIFWFFCIKAKEQTTIEVLICPEGITVWNFHIKNWGNS
jgi:hypothetical protein